MSRDMEKEPTLAELFELEDLRKKRYKYLHPAKDQSEQLIRVPRHLHPLGNNRNKLFSNSFCFPMGVLVLCAVIGNQVIIKSKSISQI